jgi:outer membrane protein assembly factor BamA
MMHLSLPLLGVLLAGSAAGAQDAITGQCATPDSIAFRGQSTIPEGDLRSGVGITAKTTISSRALRRALSDLYATNKFESDISTTCEITGDKSVLIFTCASGPF